MIYILYMFHNKLGILSSFESNLYVLFMFFNGVFYA